VVGGCVDTRVVDKVWDGGILGGARFQTPDLGVPFAVSYSTSAKPQLDRLSRAVGGPDVTPGLSPFQTRLSTHALCSLRGWCPSRAALVFRLHPHAWGVLASSPAAASRCRAMSRYGLCPSVVILVGNATLVMSERVHV
jgi:hypothetical protein